MKIESISTSKEIAEKSIFVSTHLFHLLHGANRKVSDIAYVNNESGEYVKVIMENGCTYTIDVSADSFLAIAADVINFMKFR